MTDENGQLNSGYIKEGTYVIKELNPPFGYMYSDKTTPERVIVAKAGDGDIVVKFDNIKLPQLTIKKVDSIKGEPIEGVTYRIEKTDDVSVQPATATTDKNGLIVVPHLEAGTYTVTEISTLSKYILNPTPQHVKLEGGDRKTLLFENTLYPTLVVQKRDYTTNKPVPNTTFEIRRENADGTTTTIGTYRTDENGRITLPYVPVGWYVIEETIPAQGMQMPTNPISRIYLGAGTNSYTDSSGGNIGGNSNIIITSGLDYPVINDVVNYPLNSIVIKKSDANTGKMLEGATFEVIRVTGETSGQNGTLIRTVTTNVSGVIVVTGLEAGGYAIREIKAPDNYLIAETNMQTVNLKADGTSIVEVLFSNVPYGHILITKVDALTGKPLSGARFTVTDGAGTAAGNSNGVYITDENGEALVSNLEPKSYVITETEAPENYAIDTTPQTVDVGTDGGTYKVSFKNSPFGTLVIKKYNKATNEPLAGAEFFITTSKGGVIGESNGYFTTDNQGTITISNLDKQTLVIKETKAPDGFILDQQTKTIDIEYGKTHTENFYNTPKSGLQIVKIDAETKQPLKGAKFKVYHMNNELLGEYETDGDGLIILENLDNGWYKIYESKSPDGYLIDDTPKDIEIKGNQFVKVTFENKKMAGLVIRKIDEDSKISLSGVHFRVEKQSGEFVYEGETDENGLISIPELPPDYYVIRETKEKDGYVKDNNAKVVEVKTNTPTVVTVTNKKLGGLQIHKVDQDGNPLPNVVFSVETMTGEKVPSGTGNYEHVTDIDGLIFIPDLEGNFVIRETKGKDGYQLDTAPRNTTVKANSITVEQFVNVKLGGLQIHKVDQDGNPLSNVVFSVETMTGEKVPSGTGNYEHVTDIDGLIFIPDLEGKFVIRETKGKDGYQLDTAPRNTTVKANAITVEQFINVKLGGLQIHKVDQDGNPLSNVVFSVETMTGEKVPSGTGNYEHVTDIDGLIFIPDLEGNFVIRETKGKDGYQLDTAPRNTTVKANSITVEQFVNVKLGGLQIKKINSVTREPIANVEFTVKHLNGELVGVYKTGKDGLIFIPDLNGVYTYQETKVADGYFDEALAPKTIEIKLGELKTEIVENTPASGLLIIKTDAKTGKPLQGVVFDVLRADGQRVQSSIIDQNQPNTPNNSPNSTTTGNGAIAGSFTTDANGRILINHLESGEYHIIERKQLDGYELDTTVHAVQVIAGKQTKIEITNKPLSGLRLLKIDSITKEPIFNVEFMIFDQDGKVVATAYTDNNGIIDLAAILVEGRYTIRETRAAAGYYRDDIPRTIEFIAGKMTEIVWENVPEAGQIQILKLSADDNETNALPAGTPLQGAIYEITAYKSGNVVDRIISGYDGYAVSKPLPLGRYNIKEVQSPPYYKLNSTPMDVTVEFATQIIKLEHHNHSANMGVSINKVAPKEVMQGQEIRYDIKNIRNDSTVPLSDFYWRDTIPTDAIRLEKIVTGSYNHSTKYKVSATTNKGNTMVIADNLKTTQNNVIDCSNASLGLANDEYVTSFTVYFGQVPAGFTNVEEPKVYGRVLNKSFPSGYSFANKVDVGGIYSGEWVISNSTAGTTIYSTTPSKLPKTGQ